MQLATKWQRYKNAGPTGGKVLGTDAVPTGYIDGADNIAGIRLRYDRPLKRLAIAGSNNGAATTTITFDVYIWEVSTGAWQKITTAPVTLTFGTLAYVGLPSLAPSSATYGLAEGLDCYVRIIAAGTEADGTYTFAAGPVQNE